ncbi:hypothetical protein EIK76_09990 [Rheinheimera mesophila]|uniref:Lipoprotein n=1 Tax=Rheinheimera mesophila TaxID=1547515 RepID=A0A3P3QJ54_9GAMM|nr:hypothetical protein [Rheinheimera mesophila]KKL01840.1 hypothetical protein SD53_07900 [Rheinheimera mesophila]RRJ21204.1 hypothetical protein EIK76_09990 [Rheinheimera mesophila]
MKLLIAGILLSLAACSSVPEYRSASAAGYGYSDTELGPNYHRVQFKLRGKDKAKAMDYALQRAAELTLAEGYDWFDLVAKETLVDRKNHEVTARLSTLHHHQQMSCGLLSCSSYSQSESMSEPDIATDFTEVRIDIRLGKGVSPEGQTVFQASEVLKHIKQ